MTVIQEFYCRHCNDDQGGYFTVRLHMGWDRHVVLHCPVCHHQHHRTVKDGIIYEWAKLGPDSDEAKQEEIYVPKSSWSEQPRTRAMAAAYREMREKQRKVRGVPQLREGAPITQPRDIIEESWLDRYFGRGS